jgi:hypothetical protein
MSWKPQQLSNSRLNSEPSNGRTDDVTSTNRKPSEPLRPVDFERLGDLLGETYDAPAGGTRSGDLGGAGRAGASTSGPGSEPAAGPARMLAVVWPDVVGPEVAANARPVQLRRGRLVVSASSSVWAQTLHFMSAAITTSINERLGAQVVEQIVFRHAGWEARPGSQTGGETVAGEAAPAVAARDAPASAPDRDAALSPEQKAALEAVERLDLAPDLRDKITRAMRAVFVRTEQDSVR